MVQKVIRATLFAALGMAAVVLAFGATASADDKKDDKLPDIGEIMKKAHAKTDGYLDKIASEAKAAKWEDAQKNAKSLTIAADALAKNTPPMGTKESWEKLTKKYGDNAKAVADAADKKDAKGVNAALGSIRMSCGECHKQHKPK